MPTNHELAKAGRPKVEPAWQRFDVHQIEQFRGAVLGATFNAMQMAGPDLGGSLAFSAENGTILSTGMVKGRVALCGEVSSAATTIVLNISAGPGALLALDRTHAGDVALVPPGANFDAHYGPGDIYLAATFSDQRLARAAADAGIACISGHPGVIRKAVHRKELDWMTRQLVQVHAGGSLNRPAVDEVAECLIRSVVSHSGTFARGFYCKELVAIVSRCRQHILRNLPTAISVPGLAVAAATSRRTLFRAFQEVLNITPHAYVRLLRLNRFRQELASDWREECTVSVLAQRCGLIDAGRLAGWYRTLFGENPSQTRTRNRRHYANSVL
jgi:AraC-like DNA-binding protein